MGNFARRGAKAGALALAGALAFGTAALADIDGEPIDIDGEQDVTENPNGPAIYRFADKDRVGTALQAAERTDLPWGNTAIIANSTVYADALAASPLADVLNAPVLLSKPGNSIDPRVVKYVNDNNMDVILVGGTDVFGAATVDQFTGTVERAEGANRYQTAVQLAGQAIEEGRDADDPAYDTVNIFLASGLDFPDALSAGAAAAENDGVVLLTKGSEGVDSYTYDVLSGNKWGVDHESHIAVGGPAAAAAAKGNAGGDPVEVNANIVGANRYETARQVAETYFDNPVNFAIASGENFPDGVVAGAYASNVDGPLLLTKEANLTKTTGAYLEGIRSDVKNVFVFGGVNSVSKNVSLQLANLDWTY